MRDQAPGPHVRSTARLLRAATTACGLCLLMGLAIPGEALFAQDRDGSPAPRLRSQAVGAMHDGSVDGRLLPSRALRGPAGSSGETAAGFLPAIRAAVPGSGGAAGRGLFREVSTFERGWRLVGSGSGGQAGEPDEAALGMDEEGRSEDDSEPPFLVDLFDARELMAWLREAKAWGMDTRRTLFGPHGFVRAGSIPGSERPRMRMELTDSRPGFQVVIITR